MSKIAAPKVLAGVSAAAADVATYSLAKEVFGEPCAKVSVSCLVFNLMDGVA